MSLDPCSIGILDRHNYKLLKPRDYEVLIPALLEY